MQLDEQMLLEAMESSVHVFDAATGVCEPIGVPGVRGRVGPTPFGLLNVVGMARLDPDGTEAAIDAVVERFSAEDKGFAWIVGPGTTPADLPVHLEAAGVEQFVEQAGMVLTDLDAPIPTGSSVHVEQGSWDELAEASRMMAEAFGLGVDPDGWGAVVVAMQELEDRYGTRGYLAYVEGAEDPVAFSFMTHTDVPGVAYLVSSATREEHRGQGVYRSLLARRAADARDDGAQALVVQAARHSSAPILEKAGFVEVCSMDIYGVEPKAA